MNDSNKLSYFNPLHNDLTERLMDNLRATAVAFDKPMHSTRQQQQQFRAGEDKSCIKEIVETEKRSKKNGMMWCCLLGFVIILIVLTVLYCYYRNCKSSSSSSKDENNSAKGVNNKLSSSAFRQASPTEKSSEPVNPPSSESTVQPPQTPLTLSDEAQNRDLTPDEYTRLSKIMHNYTNDNKRQIQEQKYKTQEDLLQTVRTDDNVEDKEDENDVRSRLQKQNIWLTSLQRRLNRLEALNRQVNHKKPIDND